MRVDHRVVTWRLDGSGAARGRRYRTAILVEVRDGSRVGLGEAAPLPDMSSDSLDAAREAIERFAAAPSSLAAITSPSARFALETALSDDASDPSIPSAIVVDDVEAALPPGATTLKLKVGPGKPPALPSSAIWRLDANRTWPRERVREWLGELAAWPIEFVEEPCLDAHRLLDEPLPVPIALDESLATMTLEEIERALRSPGLAALILKPTLLGGQAACRELASLARAAGKRAIVTHALEGPVGTAACRRIARAIGADVHGVAPHPALAAWRPGPAGSLDLARLSPLALAPFASGSLEELLARLDDPLVTVRGAGSRATRTVVATPASETLVAIQEAFADRAPIALVQHAEQRVPVTLPADAAVVLFTSGSTGTPRGVVLSRVALLAAADASAAHLGWRDDDRWLVALSLAHAGGLAIVVRCLVAGKPIELAPARAALAPLLERCTLASLVPTQLAALLDDPAWRPPPRLRAVLLGGAAASPALLAHAAARGVPFLATYGMTETFGQVATAPLARAGDPAAPLVALPGVDLAAGSRAAPAPITIRAPMLATCYLDGTPIAPAFTTADLGFVEDGALAIVGRTDDVIITGGENVHPATIEAVAATTPGVRAACAFGVADEHWGQLVALAIAAAPGFDRAAAAAVWHAALPPHARPRELAVVDALPLLASGKVDRRAAAALPREPIRYRRTS